MSFLNLMRNRLKPKEVNKALSGVSVDVSELETAVGTINSTITNTITPRLPKDYSETEVDTGQKWIDGKEIYCKVLTGNFPVITSTSSQTILIDHTIDSFTGIDLCLFVDSTFYPRPTQSVVYNSVSGVVAIASVTTGYSEQAYRCTLFYTKKTAPGRAPEDSEPEVETKKTTRKKKETNN